MSEHTVAKMYFDGIQKYCARHSCNKKCIFYDRFKETCLINCPFGGEQIKMPKIDDNLRRIEESKE